MNQKFAFHKEKINGVYSIDAFNADDLRGCFTKDYSKEAFETNGIAYDLAEVFKVFGDSTRIKILYVLFEAELCVCDIAQLLNMTQSAISHQLRILKQNRLVKNRRDGKSVFYSLADGHVKTIISQGMEHIQE